jgi:hypothetical protein
MPARDHQAGDRDTIACGSNSSDRSSYIFYTQRLIDSIPVYSSPVRFCLHQRSRKVEQRPRASPSLARFSRRFVDESLEFVHDSNLVDCRSFDEFRPFVDESKVSRRCSSPVARFCMRKLLWGGREIIQSIRLDELNRQVDVPIPLLRFTVQWQRGLVWCAVSTRGAGKWRENPLRSAVAE